MRTLIDFNNWPEAGTIPTLKKIYWRLYLGPARFRMEGIELSLRIDRWEYFGNRAADMHDFSRGYFRKFGFEILPKNNRRFTLFVPTIEFFKDIFK
jgi:hypothetical protein